MAQVPYRASPTVEPASQPPPDYFHLEANPERFAAAAHGLQQLGQSVSGVAELWGQIQTDSQLNNAMKESDDAVNNFEKLRGQDALDAQEGVRSRLDQIHDHYVSQLGPEQKLKFDNAYRSYQYRYLNGKISTHASNQGHEFATKTNVDAIAHASDIAAQNYNNPAIVEEQRHIARDAAVKQLQIDGQGQVQANVDEAIRRADTGIFKATAEAMYVHDPQGASKYIEDHRAELGAAYAPLADQFRTRSEAVTAETRAQVLQKINGAADPVVKKSIADANKAVLGDEIYKSMYPDQGEAPKSNVVPIKPPAETPTDQARRLLEEEKAKAQPGATPAKDELGRIGGQGASIQVPFNPLMATAEGRAQLIEQGLKTYQPGTKLTSTFGSFTIPPAGSTFQYEGKTYTVPLANPAAAPATAPNAAGPQKQSQNASPAQAATPVSQEDIEASKNGFPVPEAKQASATAAPGVAHAVTDQTQRIRNVEGYGEQLTGAMVINGHTYNFINGGGGRGSIPFGTYTVSNFRTAEQRAKQGLNNLGDTFDLSDVKDPFAGGAPRQDLRIHAAHGRGTLGCVGILGGPSKFYQFASDVKKAGITKIVLGPPNVQTAAGGQ